MRRLDKADPKKCKKKRREKRKKKKPKWADINESEWMNGGGKRHKNLNWLPRRVSVWECPPPSLPPFASPSLFPTLAEVLRPTSMRGVPVLVALFASPSPSFCYSPVCSLSQFVRQLPQSLSTLTLPLTSSQPHFCLCFSFCALLQFFYRNFCCFFCFCFAGWRLLWLYYFCFLHSLSLPLPLVTLLNALCVISFSTIFVLKFKNN